MSEAAQAQEAKATVKHKPTGDLFADVAAEVENLTKTKALNLADKLVEEIDTEYFRLGGVLKVIRDNQFYEGHPTFAAFVSTRYGFQERKARYLMDIYESLVTKQIPYEAVKNLGWSKLKELTKVLTAENAAEWAAKAEKLSVLELQAMMKGEAGTDGKTVKATSDLTTLKFKLHSDQLEVVQSALSKAKAETNTTFDSPALEAICGGYLGGVVSAAKPVSLEEQMKSAGYEAVLQAFEKIWPEIDLTVNLNQ